MRKAISKRLRFEVFKRDCFTCQYCGQAAPEVVLNVDHILPVAKGGKNDLLNLITSCFSCNSGKSDKELSDNALVLKQKKQLKEQSDRLEQIKMIAQWAKDTIETQENELKVIKDVIDQHLLDAGKEVKIEFVNNELKKSWKKYGLKNVLIAIDKSQAQYLKDVNDPNDREKFLTMIPRIAYWQDVEAKNPDYVGLNERLIKSIK
jgi:hypothetical protein